MNDYLNKGLGRSEETCRLFFAGDSIGRTVCGSRAAIALRINDALRGNSSFHAFLRPDEDSGVYNIRQIMEIR